MFRILYKEIAKLDIRHDYFDPAGQDDYDVRRFLEIVPTAETERVMDNYRLVFRAAGQGGRLLASVREENGHYQTVIPFDERVKLTFLLRIADWRFYNYTNLPLTRNSERLYYFHNRQENSVKVGGEERLYLSQPMAAYDASFAYQLGDLVRHNGNIYEAIHARPQNISKPDHWQEVGADTAYITRADGLRRVSGYFNYEAVNANPGQWVHLHLYDAFGMERPLGNIPQTQTPVGYFQAPADHEEPLRCRIDLQEFPPGRYTLEVGRGAATEKHPFFLLDALKYPGVWGVVELFFNAEVPDSYRLLDLGTSRIADPPTTYCLHFKNRSTHWRYLFPADFDMSAITPLSGFTLQDHTMVSAQPKGLHITYPDSIPKDSQKAALLPNPSPEQIHPEMKNDGTGPYVGAVYSNIYYFIRKK